MDELKVTYLAPGVSRRPGRVTISEDTLRKIPEFSRPPKRVKVRWLKRPNPPMPTWATWNGTHPPADHREWLPIRVGSFVFTIWGPDGVKWAKEIIEELV